MSPTSHLTENARKAAGAHYTPAALADFLAKAALRRFAAPPGAITVLDPACGDGSLLLAIAEAACPSVCERMRLVGYETDEVALAQVHERLASLAVGGRELRLGDFLDPAMQPPDHAYDIVISNPPYVRTQVLGATRAQELAKQFGLTGRVDLYHAFVKAVQAVLEDRGILGLLTSNRFMLTQSGAAVRELLCTGFQLHDVFDLGDTKLFDAAVLPAIVIAQRTSLPSANAECPFVRVYETRDAARESGPAPAPAAEGVLEAIDAGASGAVKVNDTAYRIERGHLVPPSDARRPWSLLSVEARQAIDIVHRHRHKVFDDVGRIRVGIKTTADSVFIRDDWGGVAGVGRPEADLLFPLITHHVADRWSLREPVTKRVLYPHESDENGKTRPIDLDRNRGARAYLESHREQLASRRYVIEGGRRWYEVWVPQHPRDWRLPKVVFPDISKRGAFFLDRTGAIVNGDCYWITLRPGAAEEWLYMLLAVGNSSFIVWYYDALYHNKLYAGRRRFMTQYVKQFPLPSLESPIAGAIVRAVRALIRSPADLDREEDVDDLVWRAFGLEESGRPEAETADG